MARKSLESPSLEAEIARLSDLGPAELRARWAVLYGRPAPKYFRRKFLILGIAYQMQVKAHGALSKGAARRLQQFADVKQAADAGRIVSNAPRIKAGTKLIRVWNDKTHTVTAVLDGFEWGGSRYRSLSEVARAITGTRWNGLVFFGVKPRPSTNKNARKKSAGVGPKPRGRGRRGAAHG